MHPFSNACKRSSPLPELDWAEQKEMWHSMVLKDSIYTRNNKVLKRHPDLEPRMRSILIDWLSEVCEVFRIHRETFHLAIDYVDRFLMAKSNLPRNYLQLLGATALFVASKMEEIYPAKLEQFAYVTDGACADTDILNQELILIMTLNWNLSPVTMNCWLNIFMQLAFLENGENLIGPERYPRKLFLQISQVLDLCVLDIESLRFPYSVLCASAIAHFISKETAMHVSGLCWSELLPCVAWMKPYVEVAVENQVPDVKLFHDIPADDAHNIQTHTAGLKLLDLVQQKKRIAKNETSPSLVLREMTPPQSSKKPHLMVIDE
ncbi:G1/S-specific cyclin-E1 [Parasteatoda tepidariorum]|uniref:G1/S-specific cyclin-E1 n=1 Tax=Parasteatoda tepidariorum TaxID=114398 RepID=UPI001C718624|nr:G1/S-specific cyclin-E1 [Parasteatoda tepidariorum]